MGLLLKINLILISVFLVTLGAVGYLSRQMVEANARQQVLANARILAQTAAAVRTYTSKQIQPILHSRPSPTFQPQTVPAYSAQQIFKTLKVSYPNYDYKEAALDPTSLRAELLERREAYRVPTEWRVVDELPRLPNGKLDRRALLDDDAPEPSSSPASATTGQAAREVAADAQLVRTLRALWERLLPWAFQTIARQPGDHQIGEHMIADQDYFQYWANRLHPGTCAELPWYWNHCEYWDESFPRLGVLFAHFSNFCNGPADDTPARIRALRKPWPRLLNRCIPPSSL